jgi:tetratricopeptide (TPR) repeat protein
MDSDIIKQIPSEKLRDPEMLAVFEREVLSLADEDDRNHVCYLLARRLTAEGVLDKAEFFTRLMESWPIERTWLFGDIAVKLWQSGQTEHALELLNEAILISRTNGREWQRGEALSRIATHLIELGQRERAISLLREAVPIAQLGEEQGYSQDSADSVSVLLELAEKLVLVGEYEEAKQVANSIKHGVERDRALCKIQAIIDTNKGAG